MARKLLFISKYRDIIQEFLDAMKDKDIQIETAQNGLEAAALLKKNEYQVVVTGLTMDGYNGEQLISYINRAHPNTACIIYTTTISAAQLHFFINKRDVFRVFLRPVNFRMEFFDALEEAFEYYAVKVKNSEENAERQEKTVENKKQILGIEQKMDNEDSAKMAMGRYMKRLVNFTLKEYAGSLKQEEWERLAGVENGMIELCCGGEKSLLKAEKAAEQLNEIVHI
ncbi:MAG: response regulator [Clostridiales bacterium]|nr:response regulator [Clostridiales bacterium]